MRCSERGQVPGSSVARHNFVAFAEQLTGRLLYPFQEGLLAETLADQSRGLASTAQQSRVK